MLSRDVPDPAHIKATAAAELHACRSSACSPASSLQPGVSDFVEQPAVESICSQASFLGLLQMRTRLAAVEVVLDQQQPGVSALAIQRLTRDADALWPGIPNPGALQCAYMSHPALVALFLQLCIRHA